MEVVAYFMVPGNNPWHTLNRTLGELQSWSEHLEEEYDLLLLVGIKPQQSSTQPSYNTNYTIVFTNKLSKVANK